MKRTLRKIWKLMKLSLGAWSLLAAFTLGPAPILSGQNGTEKNPEPSASSATTAVKSEPETRPPGAEFLKNFQRLERAAAEYDRLAGKLRDVEAALRLYREELTNLQVELQRGIPQGFRFDPEKKLFVSGVRTPVESTGLPKPEKGEPATPAPVAEKKEPPKP
jgi:hypothetical protein